jgi:nucleotide-binding universal stress UspA family protein
MFERILVPLDGSSYAEEALQQAIPIALLTSGAISIVTAVPTPVSSPSAIREADAVEETMRAYVLEQAEVVRQAGVASVTTLVIPEDPATAITEAARDQLTDLIVMATLGLGADRGHAVGSVALNVLATSPCPMLMLRIDKPAPPRTLDEARWQEEGGRNVG